MTNIDWDLPLARNLHRAHSPWEESAGILGISLRFEGHDSFECFASDDSPSESRAGEHELEQLALMITNRLEQALQFRRLEEQLADVSGRLARLEKIARLHNLIPDHEAEALSNAWDEYRSSLTTKGLLSAPRGAQLETMWQAISRNVAFAPAPQAALAEDGTFVMSWDRGQHHLEIEMLANGSFEWFYMDSGGSSREGEEEQPVGAISSAMRDCLLRTFEQWRS